MTNHAEIRADALSADDEDGIEAQAEIVARKAIVGWEAVPLQIVEEGGETAGMFESEELVDAVLPVDAFASDAVHQRVFIRAVELLNTWSSARLWQEEEPAPELPPDDGPMPKDTASKDTDPL